MNRLLAVGPFPRYLKCMFRSVDCDLRIVV
jgi:hypothetical protein